MKRLRSFILVIGMLAIGGAVIAGITVGANRYLSSAAASASHGIVTCHQPGANHSIIIMDDKAVPDHVTAPVCDTLTIANADDEIRLIAFGPHEDHQAYDGITEQALSQNQSLKITLNQAGTFHFHDHIHDEVTGDFTVTK